MLRRFCKLALGLGLLGGIAYLLLQRRTPAPPYAGVPSRKPVDPDAPPKLSDAWTGLEPTDPHYDDPASPSTDLRPDPDAPSPPRPLRAAPKTARISAVATAPWVDPVEGACPATHPVKGKLTSKIFHLPGMLNYERTRPDRCYLDAAAAEGDGLRPAKR